MHARAVCARTTTGSKPHAVRAKLAYSARIVRFCNNCSKAKYRLAPIRYDGQCGAVECYFRAGRYQQRKPATSSSQNSIAATRWIRSKRHVFLNCPKPPRPPPSSPFLRSKLTVGYCVYVSVGGDTFPFFLPLVIIFPPKFRYRSDSIDLEIVRTFFTSLVSSKFKKIMLSVNEADI